MKHSIDIMSLIYQLINVTGVTSVITGQIRLGDKPMASKLEDVTINTLTNPNERVQSGVANINIFSKNQASGEANFARLKTISDIIIPLIDDVHSGDGYYQVDSTHVYRDTENDKMSFLNIRINYQIH